MKFTSQFKNIYIYFFIIYVTSLFLIVTIYILKHLCFVILNCQNHHFLKFNNKRTKCWQKLFKLVHRGKYYVLYKGNGQWILIQSLTGKSTTLMLITQNTQITTFMLVLSSPFLWSLTKNPTYYRMHKCTTKFLLFDNVDLIWCSTTATGVWYHRGYFEDIL